MIVEIFKLFAQLLFTFLIMATAGYLYCIAIESAIRSIISGSFMAFYFVKTGH
jgi:hypothetical protein